MTNGNVWVANYYGGVASQFTALGAPVFATGVTGPGLSASYGLAVDQANNAWIPNDVFSGSVTKISADGATTANFSGNGMAYPVYTAVDTDGSVWVADYGNSTLTHLSATGAGLSGPSGYQSASTSFPTALAIDANHNVWTTNQSDYTITRINPDGTNPLVVKCCDSASGLAIDQRGYIWVTNYLGNTISQVSSAGAVISSTYTGGGIFRPQAVAIDGIGNVWIANFHAIGISELAGSQTSTPGAVLSPSSGFAPDGPIEGNFSIAVDASGNIWVANFNSNNVIRYLGLAAPTKSPTIGPAQAP
jgi:streptogramin lyase